MTAPESCPRCGSAAPAGGGEDSCPTCLMQLGLETGLAPGTHLGPYEIVARIGAGGMGEVYRARDERLKREVAIKVLPGSLSTDPDRLRRFEKEAQAASALNHPNILSIFDIGSEDGMPYIVSELLEGHTLRGKMSEGLLPLRKAVDYAAQIAKGLAAAHAKGIVHRDLKPENVFVTRDEHIKILDFGVAKLIQAEGGPIDTNLTEPGVVLGTAAYMSPEQVKGQPVDGRSDIFSFGAILYEMLSGRQAFKRETAAETMAAILKEDPPELSGSGRNIPPAVDQIVRHCLEKDPASRFQSASDIAFNLSSPSAPMLSDAVTLGGSLSKRRALVIASMLVVLAVAGALLLRQSRTVAGDAGKVKRVAVLPFENLGAAEDDYFADGIADEVRSKLTNLRGIEVIARASSTPYKKTAKTPMEIARELDVKYLLTATVRWQKGSGASRVHVTPELVEVRESGAPASKWGQPFDASLTDVFRVQSQIATRVAEAMGNVLGSGDVRRLEQTPTQNLDAYDAFLRGEDASKGMGIRNATSLRQALRFYEQAVALDPGFAPAWARVSEANSALYYISTPTLELADRARQTAEKAAALAPDLPEAYLALGDYEAIVAGNFARALEQYSRGQRIAPNNGELLSATGRVERSLGHWPAALDHLRQAERVDPRSVLTQQRLGAVLFLLRHYEQAREAYDRGLALAPANLDTIQSKAVTFLGEGNLAGARAVLAAAPKEIEPAALVAYMANSSDLAWVLDERQRELLLRLKPGDFDDDRAVWGICLAQGYALMRDSAQVRVYAEAARQALEEQLRANPDDAQRRVFLGLTLAYLGRKEEAIREGQRGVASRPIAVDAVLGAYLQHQLVRIDILVGEPEKALDLLEPLLSIPTDLSPGWLRIDPNFDPLRGNPRFQKLVAQKG